MMDEAELLRQLGAKLPPRADGKRIAPPLPDTPDAAGFLRQLESKPAVSVQDKNKIAAARTRQSTEARGGAGRSLRQGFAHLRAYSRDKDYGALDLDAAFPDRRYGMDVLLAEGDQVWMRFNVGGTHRGPLCGIAPTGKRVGVNGVSIMNFKDGQWLDSWTFADELGLLLQLGHPDRLIE